MKTIIKRIFSFEFQKYEVKVEYYMDVVANELVLRMQSIGWEISGTTPYKCNQGYFWVIIAYKRKIK